MFQSDMLDNRIFAL